MIRPSVWRLSQFPLLVLLAALIYGRGLGVAALSTDEREIHARAAMLAERHGHDVDGRLLPLFLQSRTDGWLAPVPVYLTGLLTIAAPDGPVNARWVAVAFGITDIALLFVLATWCFQNRVAALAAALTLLVTPAHVLFSQSAAADGIWPVPFILLWVIGLAALASRPSSKSRWTFAAGAASLAAVPYVQASALLLVPVLALVTVRCFRRATTWRAADAVPAVVTSAAMLLPLFVWFVSSPDRHAYSFVRWLLEPADVRSMFRAATVVKTFWDFWLPSHLFFRPDVAGFCGMFLIPMAIPLVVGVRASTRGATDDGGVIDRLLEPIMTLCVVAPMIAATAIHPPADGQSLAIVPFGVLISIRGALRMWRNGSIVGRLVLGALLLAAVLQAAACLRSREGDIATNDSGVISLISLRSSRILSASTTLHRPAPAMPASGRPAR